MNDLSLTDVAATPYETPLLRVSGLCKNFGAVVACRNVSFALWPGEVLGVVGESGSGKTTLLNCVSARLQPDAGRIEFQLRDGRVAELFEMSEPARRMLMRTDWGIVHQNPRDGLRLGVSAGANVGERLMAVGARHYGEIRGNAADWLRKVEIEVARIDDPPRTFSGGMQRRLNLACALLHRPALLLLDEPTVGLDPQARAALFASLRRLRDDDCALVFTTHYLDEAEQFCDRLGIMDHSRLIAVGTLDELCEGRRCVPEGPHALRGPRLQRVFLQVTGRSLPER